MATLPMKTTEADLRVVTGYLKSQVGWVPVDRIRKAVPPKHANAMKVDAMRRLGLIDRDGQNVKLTTDGREFAEGDADGQAAVIEKRLKADELYHQTLEWMHYSGKSNPTKTDIANYWHDDHQAVIGEAKGDALTDATVFFMRMVGLAKLGKFVSAGRGRDSHLVMDAARLEEYATGATTPPVEDPPPPGGGTHKTPVLTPPPGENPPGSVSLGTGLNVNVEIHIAADAKPATIEEIFKNMRRYLIDGSPTPDAD